MMIANVVLNQEEEPVSAFNMTLVVIFSLAAIGLTFAAIVVLDLYDPRDQSIRSWLSYRGWLWNYGLLALMMIGAFLLFLMRETFGPDVSQMPLKRRVVESMMLVTGIKVFLFCIEKAFSKMMHSGKACLATTTRPLAEAYGWPAASCSTNTSKLDVPLLQAESRKTSTRNSERIT
jgi:hypothetical protein